MSLHFVVFFQVAAILKHRSLCLPQESCGCLAGIHHSMNLELYVLFFSLFQLRIQQVTPIKSQANCQAVLITAPASSSLGRGSQL